jgi:hypothetical protein
MLVLGLRWVSVLGYTSAPVAPPLAAFCDPAQLASRRGTPPQTQQLSLAEQKKCTRRLQTLGQMLQQLGPVSPVPRDAPDAAAMLMQVRGMLMQVRGMLMQVRGMLMQVRGMLMQVRGAAGAHNSSRGGHSPSSLTGTMVHVSSSRQTTVRV